jgi:hypothetical protein
MDFHAPENFDTPNSTINKATKLSTKETWRGIERGEGKKAKKECLGCWKSHYYEADTKN